MRALDAATRACKNAGHARNPASWHRHTDVHRADLERRNAHGYDDGSVREGADVARQLEVPPEV